MITCSGCGEYCDAVVQLKVEIPAAELSSPAAILCQACAEAMLGDGKDIWIYGTGVIPKIAERIEKSGCLVVRGA